MSNAINTTVSAPFVDGTGEFITTPAALLTRLLGDTDGNPANKTFVCKPYLNGKPVNIINNRRIPNIMIAGGKSTFTWLNMVLRTALATKELPNYYLNYSVTGKGIHNFPTKDAVESEAVSVTIELPAEVQAVLDECEPVRRQAKEENIGNINLVRVDGTGANINVGYMANSEENAVVVRMVTSLLPVCDLTWHLEFTKAGKAWFNLVK